ncbi:MULTISPECIES: helix-turn-helix domain-containing protein [unclassified Serratia (in: enterobacteria)]|uniref:helix-turn-helix domain-containing protein n=1 Tax=unclassified Serratia (in: enterobacteria) TaxID=2647522 RepID=UPI000469D844|nr:MULTISPECIES: helix-turn-helix domain-containing protein [unclassified Serratia (in: enterobacteria)]
MLLLSSAEIARFSAVSRTHINRILQAAEKSGLLTTKNNVLIELNSSFIMMAERYFSLYMAMVGYGLDAVSQECTAKP